MLDAGIEQGGCGKRDEQVSGVGREYVAKKEDMRLPSAEYLIKECGKRNGEENAEKP